MAASRGRRRQTEAAILEAGAEPVPAEEAAPAEPVTIEIWRPQRHHGRRREHGQDQQPRRHGGPRRPHGAPARPTGETQVEGQAPEGAQPAQERPRRDDRRPEGGKPRFEGKREGGRRFEGKFDGKKRDDQRGGDRPPHHEKRPPREKQADPDSPFAKLAALKAELEARNKKG